MSRTEDIFGLSENEFNERARLRERRRDNLRWFSQEEFDRLAELNKRVADHTLSMAFNEAINIPSND